VPTGKARFGGRPSTKSRSGFPCCDQSCISRTGSYQLSRRCDAPSDERIPMIRYIELKTGYNDNGPAWIGRVQVSRSGQTVYFNGRAFKRRGGGASGNHFDVETGDNYWISGVKKDGRDRHWAGSGKSRLRHQRSRSTWR